MNKFYQNHKQDKFSLKIKNTMNICYELVEKIAEKNIPYGCGIFGADMDVEFCNQGPVTILLESKK